jgi:hypothetical protein
MNFDHLKYSEIQRIVKQIILNGVIPSGDFTNNNLEIIRYKFD